METPKLNMRVTGLVRRSRSMVCAICMAFIFSFQTSAQNIQQILDKAVGRKYEEVVKEMENLYLGKEKGPGSGYKQIQRWLDFQKTRLSKDGRIQNISSVLTKESNKYDAEARKRKALLRTEASALWANWSLLGATSYIPLANGYSSGVGRVNIAVADPSNNDIIYAGTPAAGLWRSTNGGTTWSLLTGSLPSIVGISGIVVDASSPVGNRTIYILTGDGDYSISQSIGVYKSVDNGVTWAATGLTGSAGNGRKLVRHPTNSSILFAVLHSGIYRTTNGGSTWTNVLSGFFYDLEFKPTDPNIVYAGTNGMVYRSTNAGVNWTQMTSGLPASSSDRVSIAVTPANPNYIYVLYGRATGAGTYAGLYQSTNGTSFTLKSTTPNILGGSELGDDASDQAWYDLALAVSPTNVNEVHVGGINIWKSINGGTSWALEAHWVRTTAGAGNYTHADIHDLSFQQTTMMLCGSDGGIFKSYNNGEDWVDITAGLAISHIYRISSDRNVPDKTLCGLQDNGLTYITNNILYQWFGADGMEVFAHPTDPNKLYGSTQNGGLLKTTDGGVDILGISPASNGNWITPFLMDPNNASTLYCGFEDVYKSTTEGASWENITNGQIGSLSCDHVVVDPSNSANIFAVKGSSIYRTINGGTAWTQINNPDFVYVNRMEVDPKNSNILYVVTYGAVHKVTLGSGATATWALISNATLPNVSYNCIAKDKTSSINAMYLGTDLGMFYKDDNSVNWVEFNDGLPKAIVNDIDIHYATRTLRIGTVGRGAWKSPMVNNTSITVQLTAPASGIDVFEGTSLTLNSNASTTTGSITKVEFYDKGIKLGEDLTAPYSYTIGNILQGEHLFNAVAYGSDGKNAVSSEVIVYSWKLRVPENPTSTLSGMAYKYYEGLWYSLPNFASLSPVKTGNMANFDILTDRNVIDNYGFSYTGYINVPTSGIYTFYTASDDGSKLYIGSTTVVNNDGLHGAVEVNGKIALQAGKHAFTVEYFELDGGEELAVYYAGPGIAKQLIPSGALFRNSVNNTPPSVSITSPVNNATFAAPASVSIAATASDADGTISKVEFYQGATKLGEDLTSPYTYTWSGVAVGTYSLTAVAYDNGSASTVSSAITITVNNASQTDFCFEGESASGQSTFAPYQVLSDANASGGQYIVVPNGVGNQSIPPSNSIATYQFNVSQSGTYYIWVRILANTSNDNSLLIRTDNTSYVSWTPGTYTSWTWKKWTSKSFTVGAHSVAVARGEDGLQIDKVLVTKSSSTPTGLGCTSGAVAMSESESNTEEQLSESTLLDAQLVLVPNPSAYNFSMIAHKDIAMVSISNSQGTEVFVSKDLYKGSSIAFGQDFVFGIYNIVVKYADGTAETLKVLKTR